MPPVSRSSQFVKRIVRRLTGRVKLDDLYRLHFDELVLAELIVPSVMFQHTEEKLFGLELQFSQRRRSLEEKHELLFVQNGLGSFMRRTLKMLLFELQNHQVL